MKFSVRIEQTKKRKTRSIGRVLRYVTYFFKFWDTLNISGMGIGRDFKFGLQIHRLAYEPKNAKVGQKWRGLRRVTYFYNFGTPFISLEQTKLETLNLVYGLIVRLSKQKNAKVGQKRCGLRHLTYFCNFGTPSISLK